MPTIDKVTYRKDTIHPPRWGYQARGNVVPSSIIMHTTSNRRKTAFETEATFIRDSADISAHYLIGKSGQIVEFLSPSTWQAWHAGAALPAYINAHSIGIEHHVSIGEGWTGAQAAASTWLVQLLMIDYGITPALIETHRAVALPKGRKSDPTGWSDEAFYRWRATLAPPVSLPTAYTVAGLPIFERQDLTGPIAAFLDQGETILIDQTYPNGAGHDKLGRGFVDLRGLKAL